MWVDGVAGKEVLQYMAPEPPVGIHRLVLILFSQNKTSDIPVMPPPARHNFRTRNFAAQYGFGLPVAGVYFNVRKEPTRRKRRWDESVCSAFVYFISICTPRIVFLCACHVICNGVFRLNKACVQWVQARLIYESLYCVVLYWVFVYKTLSYIYTVLLYGQHLCLFSWPAMNLFNLRTSLGRNNHEGFRRLKSDCV